MTTDNQQRQEGQQMKESRLERVLKEIQQEGAPLGFSVESEVARVFSPGGHLNHFKAAVLRHEAGKIRADAGKLQEENPLRAEMMKEASRLRGEAKSLLSLIKDPQGSAISDPTGKRVPRVMMRGHARVFLQGATPESRTVAGLDLASHGRGLGFSLLSRQWLRGLYASFLSAKGYSRGEWERINPVPTVENAPEMVRFLQRQQEKTSWDNRKALPSYQQEAFSGYKNPENGVVTVGLLEAIQEGDYQRPLPVVALKSAKKARAAVRKDASATGEKCYGPRKAVVKAVMPTVGPLVGAFKPSFLLLQKTVALKVQGPAEPFDALEASRVEAIRATEKALLLKVL